MYIAIRIHPFIFVGNTTEQAATVVADSIKMRMKDALYGGTLCQDIIMRGASLNVTQLISPEGKAFAGAICKEIPVFTTVFTPAATTQSFSSSPGQPNSTPTTVIVASSSFGGVIGISSFMGILSLIMLIGLLRFNYAMSVLPVQKNKKEDHLYNILVVLNDFEEAVLENIRHDDIIFFRGTEINSEADSNDWVMNTTTDVLERRFEVQFYDKYDLLGKSGVNEDKLKCKNDVKGEKTVVKEDFEHQAKLLVGMIITVKELDAKASRKKRETVEKKKSTGLY